MISIFQSCQSTPAYHQKLAAVSKRRHHVSSPERTQTVTKERKAKEEEKSKQNKCDMTKCAQTNEQRTTRISNL